MKQFLFNVWTKIMSIIIGVFDLILLSTKNVKTFVVAALLVMIAVDIFFLGKLGFIKFIIDMIVILATVIDKGSKGLIAVIIALIVGYIAGKEKKQVT